MTLGSLVYVREHLNDKVTKNDSHGVFSPSLGLEPCGLLLCAFLYFKSSNFLFFLVFPNDTSYHAQRYILN